MVPQAIWRNKVPPEKVGQPTRGQHWRSESFKELHKSLMQFSRVVLAPTSNDMFAILSDLAGLPEPLVIGVHHLAKGEHVYWPGVPSSG